MNNLISSVKCEDKKGEVKGNYDFFEPGDWGKVPCTKLWKAEAGCEVEDDDQFDRSDFEVMVPREHLCDDDDDSYDDNDEGVCVCVCQRWRARWRVKLRKIKTRFS